jgi:hypothetical protein
MTQGVRDALADAETLRKFLRSIMTPHEWTFRSGLCYRYPRKGTCPDPVSVMWKARAAFRACPGLRGQADEG